ncbi:hypothetical protein L5L91_19950 [Shewanella sp. SM55]|uniref:hypothetical protein n=1 Tax=Shewanella sp. SM55 TaxID=2912800 RepID=UPI0021D9CEAD|nr:hypothetical protein [Shewanella sp. SM55]MCU8063013.1 hypothetical protein [Shewanella sp. SM55]
MTEKTSVKKMTKHALNEHEKFGNDQGCLAPSADDIDLFSYAEKLSEEMREKKVKFRLNYSGKDNFFLPSLNECIEFIVGTTYVSTVARERGETTLGHTFKASCKMSYKQHQALPPLSDQPLCNP